MTIMPLPATSGGLMSRRYTSTKMNTAMATSAAPLAMAARISPR